jgi:hypothetical protein
MSENDENHIINKHDFGMPYLKIKKNPQMYSSAVDFSCLEDSLTNLNANIQLGNIFKQTQKVSPTTKILYGLDAVYADLVLLRLLRSENYATENFQHSSMDRLGGAIQFISNKHSGGMGSNQTLKPVNEWEVQCVSAAELQLAVKIASADTIIMKNPNGKDKRHLGIINPEIDDKTLHMLNNVLDICKRKGSNRGGLNNDRSIR